MSTLNEEEKFVRDQIIKIYEQLVINCRNVSGAAYKKYGQDLLAYCVEIYLSKPLEVQLKVIADNKLENYITKLMNFQLKLGTTGFYHKYRKHHEKQREYLTDYIYSPASLTHNLAFQDEPNQLMDCMKKVVDDLDPYKKMLVDNFITEKNSFTDVGNKFNITYSHLSRDLKALKLEIKNKCKHFL